MAIRVNHLHRRETGMSGKELAIRSAIGATVAALAVLFSQGWPTNAEQTATVIVFIVAGAGASVAGVLGPLHRMRWQQAEQDAPKRGGPDRSLWAVVGVVFGFSRAVYLADGQFRSDWFKPLISD
jgi:hypothetical protein